ncbi:MAG TPA: hypothetical protein VHX17_01920 [Candidatus Cybelea sp.]|jgi:hypothetical protein|nr:hypothetical protein [Candidatus Cybelea sp.]
MNTTGFARYAGAFAALAMCSACGGSGIAPSNPALGGGYLGTAASVGRVPGVAAFLPDPTSKSKTFEYIVDDYGSYASIFDYPKSDKQIGKIADVGGQACTNVLYGYGKKNFWIVAGSDQIAEYAAPKKLIKTLSVPPAQMPSSCAWNTNGDLVVGILDGSESGDLVIFKNASGSGTFISTPLAQEYFEGYDNKGNLFFDGISHDDTSQLDEMPKGTTKIQTITTSNAIRLPGSVQWDGTYLTVTDMEASAMYRYTIAGTQATLESTVSLKGASQCTQTWIAKGIVFCADAGNNGGEIFKYPAGGSPIATFKGKFDLPLGTVAVKND